MQRYISKIRFLVGNAKILSQYHKRIKEGYPLCPYDDNVCGFLDDLSKQLRFDAEAKKYPDILTFAFWCRKGNILKLKKISNMKTCIGRGMIFHIPPTCP
jgi:hypothetical protein